MTGLAFLGFLLVAALLYWRCRSALVSAPQNASGAALAQGGVIEISGTRAAGAEHDEAPDPVRSGLMALLKEKSAALQAYDKHLREVGSDPTLRRVLERLRAEDMRQLEELQQQLRDHQQHHATPRAA